MLRFFRKIRLNLFFKGQAARYLGYALGEIVLIVIGILIALKIQNWNEQNKLDAYEISILREISSALKSDQEIIEEHFVTRLELKENAQRELMSLAGQGTDVSAEEFMKLFSDLAIDFSFGFNSAPYDNLKSAGFERISNSDLRRHIINTYSILFPKYEEFIVTHNRDNDRRSEDSLGEFLQEKLITENGETRIVIVPRVDQVITHPSFLRVLNFETWKAQHQRYRLDSIIEFSENLEQSVNAEIERLTSN